MLDFTTVTREFRGLVDRRREIFTFLGSAFAAMGIFLANALEGKLPESLKAVQEHLFAFYALVLMVISLILALRMAKLHAGMVLNGVLYARLLQEQTFTRPGNPQRAAKHNLFGVSFIQFVLVDLIAGYSTVILLLALDQEPLWAVAVGAGIVLVWLWFYFRFHSKAVEFAHQKIANEPTGPVVRESWREHVSLSLTQANHGLLSEIAFAGLMVFSCFGAMTGLGNIQAKNLDIGADVVKNHGPLFFGCLMTITCLLEMVIYLRVRVAIGNFSLQLDSTDKPFRLFRLTDSLLGYMLLAFLFCVSMHVTILMMVPKMASQLGLMLGIDVIVFGVALLFEQMTLAGAARATK